jgi:recombination protein RecA
MPVDPSRRNEVVAALEKQYEGTIQKGDEFDSPDRIPTGSLELDYITNGGIPMGRWTRFYGSFSSTKTRSVWSVIAEAQKMGLECVYYNAEKQYEPESVARTGVDISELEVVDGSTIEEIGEKLEAMLGVAHVHVIDSCSNAISLDELNADTTEWRPGIASRAWRKVLLRAHERFDHRENTVILIDQMSMNFGGGGKMKGGATEEPKGGKFLGFLSSLSLKFEKGKWLWYDKDGYLTDDGKKAAHILNSRHGDSEPDGQEIKVRCEKSRVGRPLLPARMRFDSNEFSFDRDWEYVKAAKDLGIVEQNGSWYTYTPPGEKKGDKRQSEKGIRELIQKYDLYDMIHERQMSLHHK